MYEYIWLYTYSFKEYCSFRCREINQKKEDKTSVKEKGNNLRINHRTVLKRIIKKVLDLVTHVWYKNQPFVD